MSIKKIGFQYYLNETVCVKFEFNDNPWHTENDSEQILSVSLSKYIS